MNAQLRTAPRIRAKRAVNRLYAGRLTGLGQSYGKTWVIVLRCYDAGIAANGPPGNRWDRWAANCRGDA